MSTITAGLKNETSRIIEQRHLASEWGSGLADVLATPVLVAFCEECARLMVDPLLPDGQQTVGTRISIRHLAATPPDLQVTVRAELKEVDGRRLLFHIEAWDDVERIAEAEHERFIIDEERFQQRLSGKLQRFQEM